MEADPESKPIALLVLLVSDQMERSRTMHRYCLHTDKRCRNVFKTECQNEERVLCGPLKLDSHGLGDGLGHMGSLACNLQCIEAYVNFSAQAC